MKVKSVFSKLAMFLLCFCLLAALPLRADAATVASGEWGENIKWSLDDEGILTISGKGEMKSCRNVKKPWNEYTSDIIEIVVKSGVTNVSEYAFNDLKNLEYVELADTVTSVDYCAFGGSALKEVDLGNGVQTIDKWAFRMSKLTSVEIPDSVITIGEGAFEYCHQLTRVTIGDGVKTIGPNAFKESGKLQHLDLGNSVETIGHQAFLSCNLLSLVLPDSVRTIEYNGFSQNKSLVSLDLRNGVQTLGSSAFSGCSALPYIEIPDSVTSMDYGVFSNCDSVEYVIIGDGLVDIPKDAFHSCDNLKSVTFGKNVASIGQAAFSYTGLTEVTIPATVKEYGESVFYNSDLTTAVVHSSAPISKSMFADCSNLVNVQLNHNIKSIGSSAFSSCKNLKEVILPDSLTELKGSTFYNCWKLERVIMSDDVSFIDGYVFNGSSLTTLAVPDSVTSIGARCFGSNMENLYLCGDAISFDGYAFYYELEVNCFYPENNDTWSDLYFKNYYGKPTWTTFSLPAGSELVSGNTEDGFVSLDWDGVDGAVRYLVYRSTRENRGFKKIGFTTGTNFVDTSGEPGQTYYYKMRTITANGVFTEYSNVVEGVNLALAAPKVSVSNVNGTGKPRIEWDKVEGAVKYQVYVSEEGEDFRLLTTTSNKRVNHTSSVAGKEYRYYVVSVSETGAQSGKSNTVRATSKLAQPVVTMKANEKTGKTIITWSKVKGAKNYEVYYAVGSSMDYTLLKVVKGTTLNHNSVVAGTKYRYKVKAICENPEGDSVFSSSKFRTPDLARPDVTVKLNKKGKPALDWDNISGAKGYKVYIYNTNGKLLKTINTKNSSLTHSSAVKDVTYNYRVVALHNNSAADSAKSIKDTITSK